MNDITATFVIPGAVAASTVQAFCALYGYVPPADANGVPLGNDTLGCDSLGIPTAAGITFTIETGVVGHCGNVTLAYARKQIDGAAGAQLAAAQAAIQLAAGSTSYSYTQGS